MTVREELSAIITTATVVEGLVQCRDQGVVAVLRTGRESCVLFFSNLCIKEKKEEAPPCTDDTVLMARKWSVCVHVQIFFPLLDSNIHS